MIDNLVKEAAERLDTLPSKMNWWTWPEYFGSTSGPRGGIGGAAVTKFQVFLFEGADLSRLLYCGGVWKNHTWREHTWKKP